jgi:hypothetical protein
LIHVKQHQSNSLNIMSNKITHIRKPVYHSVSRSYEHRPFATVVSERTLSKHEGYRTVTFGFSVCSSKDQFVKKVGVEIANQRLSEQIKRNQESNYEHIEKLYYNDRLDFSASSNGGTVYIPLDATIRFEMNKKSKTLQVMVNRPRRTHETKFR